MYLLDMEKPVLIGCYLCFKGLVSSPFAVHSLCTAICLILSCNMLLLHPLTQFLTILYSYKYTYYKTYTR